MTQLFANNAASSIQFDAGTTSIVVAAGTGSKFPSPTGGDFFMLTLTQPGAESSWEIVKCTARSTDTLTVVRAQEGTTTVSWPVGSKAEARFTAGSIGANAPKVIASWGIASGIAPAGTVGVNGALALTVAIAANFASTLSSWLWFPAGAVYAGSLAGSYWTVFAAGNQNGTVFNITLPVGTTPYLPVAPPAVSGTGTAYVPIVALTTFMGITIPGGVMGKNGTVRMAGYLCAVGGPLILRWGPANLYGLGTNGAGTQYYDSGPITNVGVDNLQIFPSNYSPTYGGSASPGITYGGATASPITIGASLGAAASTAYGIILSGSVVVYPAN
jgi:hypothetical protein